MNYCQLLPSPGFWVTLLQIKVHYNTYSKLRQNKENTERNFHVKRNVISDRYLSESEYKDVLMRLWNNNSFQAEKIKRSIIKV